MSGRAHVSDEEDFELMERLGSFESLKARRCLEVSGGAFRDASQPRPV